MKKNLSKQKVIHAASILFFQKGFHGTSIRDIAEKAGVNVSSISYYFNSKQGLLEYAVTNYYEAYIDVLEDTIKDARQATPIEKLHALIFSIIQYKQNNYQLTCLIQRELSLDSVFVREMTVTYLAKENHYLEQAFFDILGDIKVDKKRYLLMQLKGILIAPYVLYNDWKNYIIGDYSHDLFVQKYVEVTKDWLEFVFRQYGMMKDEKLVQ